ncbi:MAG: hypothetical protein ABI462_11045 [Ignavibacteria bacterium]
MKDKSRFISSVIVSLLAGFIYYQFGHGIEDKLQSSIKAVLSSNENDMEQYLSPDCQPFTSIIAKSDAKLNKKRSKYFIKKRNFIEFKTGNETIPGDELFSSYIAQKQAKVQKTAADKNLDFTAELELLIKKDNSKTDLHQSKGFKIDKRTGENVVADSREFSYRPERIQKNFEIRAGTYGYGFEYNYIIIEQNKKSKIEKKTTGKTTSRNTSESYIPFRSYETYKNNESYKYQMKIIYPQGTPTAPEVYSKGCDKVKNKNKVRKIDDIGEPEGQPEVIIPFMNGNDDDM